MILDLRSPREAGQTVEDNNSKDEQSSSLNDEFPHEWPHCRLWNEPWRNSVASIFSEQLNKNIHCLRSEFCHWEVINECYFPLSRNGSSLRQNEINKLNKSNDSKSIQLQHSSLILLVSCDDIVSRMVSIFSTANQMEHSTSTEYEQFNFILGFLRTESSDNFRRWRKWFLYLVRLQRLPFNDTCWLSLWAVDS